MTQKKNEHDQPFFISTGGNPTPHVPAVQERRSSPRQVLNVSFANKLINREATSNSITHMSMVSGSSEQGHLQNLQYILPLHLTIINGHDRRCH
jgi:hypothetical protein